MSFGNMQIPLLAGVAEDALDEERRKLMEREQGAAGLTLLSGSSLSGKPLLSNQIVTLGGGL